MLGCSSLSGVITLNPKSCVIKLCCDIIAILEHIRVMSDHGGSLQEGSCTVKNSLAGSSLMLFREMTDLQCNNSVGFLHAIVMDDRLAAHVTAQH